MLNFRRSSSLHLQPAVLTSIDIIHLAENKIKAYSTDSEQSLLELTEPAVIMDWAGRVLVWYLPEAVSHPNQVRLICDHLTGRY
jgi:hypothetical protein